MSKVKFGISNCHYAVITETQNGITYGTPVALPGAVSFSADPEGETSPFYADNIVYYQSVSNQGYSGDLELAQISDAFAKDVLGQIEDSNGALIESSNDVNKKFALMFQIETDDKARRVVYYNCTAQRPSSEANTKEESIEPQTDTLNITMTARSTDQAVKAVLPLTDDNADVYNAFFTQVYEKATASV